MRAWIALLLSLACGACALRPQTLPEGIPGEISRSPTGLGAGLRTLQTPTYAGTPVPTPRPSPSPTPEPKDRPKPKHEDQRGAQADPPRKRLLLELHGLAYLDDRLFAQDSSVSDFRASVHGFGLALGGALDWEAGALSAGYRYEQASVPLNAVTLSDGPLTLRTHELYAELAGGLVQRWSLGLSLGLGLPEHRLSEGVLQQCPGCSEELRWGLGARAWLGYSYPLGDHLRFKLNGGVASYYHDAVFQIPGKAQRANVNFQWVFFRPGLELMF